MKDIEKDIKTLAMTVREPYFTMKEWCSSGWSTKFESLADQIISLATMMVVFSDT